MFISSATRKKPQECSLNYNLRPLPLKGTTRRNPDEDFVLNGLRSPINNKPKNYRSNTQLTLSRSSSPALLEASVSKTDIPPLEYNETQSHTDILTEQHYQGDADEFDDRSEPELLRLKEDTLYIDNPEETAWYIHPVHRSQNTQVDLQVLARKSPLQASVLRSNMEGSIYPASQEVIDKIPIESFDVALFRNAEDEMLSCRTLTALTSPYQYKLAKLRMERLKLEEERLLQMKTLSELERIRGPSPRWYEMKTPAFHMEAKKNNQMLASKGHYKEIMDYRHELLSTLERSQMADRL